MRKGVIQAGSFCFSLAFLAPTLASIERLPTSTIGFIGMATRGQMDVPILVQSWAEFVEMFGEHDQDLPNPYLAPSVFAFFDNGGSRAYIVRVADDSDSAYIGSRDSNRGRTGLESFRGINEISLIAIPGVASPTVQSAMMAHCEELGDRFAILDPENLNELDAVQEQRRTLVSDRGYAALYYPWVKTNWDGGDRILPPSGFVAGLYARTDRVRGVWKAPAGETIAAEGLCRALADREAAILNDAGISVLRSFPDIGVVVWGARTISSDSEWKYVNVRRFATFLEESLAEGTKWAVFEPNDEPLWLRLRECVGQFLFEHWRAGALQGSTPEDAYFVKVDRSSMTQEDIDQGRTVILVGVAVLRPAEFVVIRIVQERAEAGVDFRRGDGNADGRLDISDATATLGYLFLGMETPRCLDAADVNDSGTVDLSDAIYGLTFLFLGGPAPGDPFGVCGADPTSDLISCEMYPSCGEEVRFLVTLRNGPDEPRYQFVTMTSDPAVIARSREELALPEDERRFHVSGRLARGDGGFNAPWSWHIIPGAWDLAEFSIELCDGLPEHIEGDLDYWVDTIGHFCPWSSFIREEL